MAKLGYATTLELLREVAARINVSDTIGEEIDLNYRTTAPTDIDKSARIQEIKACLDLFVNTPTHEYVQNLNARIKALESEEVEQ
jgi:hypothetical protein